MIVREAAIADVPELCGLLNDIIARGGTTAYEEPLDPETFADHFVTGADVVSCFVAEQDGVLIGFQTLEQGDPLPVDVCAIASFSRSFSGVRGAGRALFPKSRAAAIAAGFRAIDAQIRADNVPGLGYYGAMGFVEYDVVRGVPLSDGTPVDRVRKRYDLMRDC